MKKLSIIIVIILLISIILVKKQILFYPVFFEEESKLKESVTSPPIENEDDLLKTKSRTSSRNKFNYTKVQDSYINSDVNLFVEENNSSAFEFHLDNANNMHDDRPDLISKTFRENGIRLFANIESFKSLQVDTIIEMVIQDLGINLKGSIVRNKSISSFVSSTRVDFESESSISYLTMFFYRNGLIEGKLYSPNNNYVIQGSNSNLYLIEMNELSRLEGNPITD